jgi:hypothetical protein
MTSIIRVTRKLFLRSIHQSLITVNIVPSSPILVTLMMKAIHSSETSVLTTVTERYISETAVFIVTALKAKSYIALNDWAQ